ncbi:MAG: tetratricopeptide repeat protein [Burkholderiaceae bacterium]|jgi:tetratricopeptide (TPR) repeat protein
MRCTVKQGLLVLLLAWGGQADLALAAKAKPRAAESKASSRNVSSPLLVQAQALDKRALEYDTHGQLPEAENLYAQALALRERALGQDHPDVVQSLYNLASVRHDQNKIDSAIGLYEQTARLQEKLNGANDPGLALTLYQLGLAHNSRLQTASARAALQRSLAIRSKIAADPLDTADSLFALGQVEENANQLAEAQDYYRRALAIRERTLGPNHVEIANALYAVATTYRKQNQHATAIPLEDRAEAMLNRLSARTP